jgi:hypothetical protein
MGKGEGSSAETKANDLSSRQKKNRGGTAGKVGEAEGCEEESGVELRVSRGCDALQIAAFRVLSMCPILLYSPALASGFGSATSSIISTICGYCGLSLNRTLYPCCRCSSAARSVEANA